MFLRATVRKKDGKEHTYYSVVENKRLADGRVVQRHVLYLGEINSSQQLAWRKSIEVLDEEHPQSTRTIALFPEDRCESVVSEDDVVRLRLSQLRLERPRQWGGCWLALQFVSGAGTRCVLGAAAAALSQGHAVGSGIADPGGVPAAVSGQRVATTPGVVREECA
jgi:hypothetical protein